MFRSLRSKNYRLYFFGQGLSLIGTWMQHVAVSWLAYRLTGSAFYLGIVAFSQQIPTFFLSPLAGVIADRVDRRRYIILLQSLLFLQAGAMGLLTLFGFMTIHLLMVMAVIFGMLNAADIPLRQSFILEIVHDKEDISNAIGLNAILLNVARLAGPSLAGFLIAWHGEGVCFLINAFSFFPLIGALTLMQLPARPAKEEGQNFWQGLLNGIRYVRDQRPIRNVLLFLVLVSLVGVPYGVLMPIFAGTIFQGDARVLGFLLGSSGVGALMAGIFLSLRNKGVQGYPDMMARCAAVFGLALIAFSLSNHLPLSMGLLVISGFGIMIVNAVSITLLQTLASENMRGRVMSFYVASFLGMAPIGSFLAGVVAEKIGAPLTVRISGALCVIGAMLFASVLKSR